MLICLVHYPFSGSSIISVISSNIISNYLLCNTKGSRDLYHQRTRTRHLDSARWSYQSY